MEQFRVLLEIVADGNGSHIIVTIKHTNIQIESDVRTSIFDRFARSLPNIGTLFIRKPSFYEKLGLLHIKKMAFEGSYDKFGCLISGVLKPLVKEKLLIGIPAFTRQSNGEHVLCASSDEVKDSLAAMSSQSLNAVPQVFTAGRSAGSNVIVKKSVFKKAYVIGQFNREFIIVVHSGIVLAIDQHALHERVLLESLLEENDVDMYAQSDDMEELKSMACRNAVRFGQTISREKLLKLVRSMASIKYPTACAHGRISVCALPFANTFQSQSKENPQSSI
eukprot:jgi/Antlo1/638/2493